VRWCSFDARLHGLCWTLCMPCLSESPRNCWLISLAISRSLPVLFLSLSLSLSPSLAPCPGSVSISSPSLGPAFLRAILIFHDDASLTLPPPRYLKSGRPLENSEVAASAATGTATQCVMLCCRGSADPTPSRHTHTTPPSRVACGPLSRLPPCPWHSS
jgi:hypothetical protein